MKAWRVSFGAKALLGAMVALFGLASQARAIPTLVFDQDNDGGEVAFTGGGTLTGNDVVFEFVTFFDTPANPLHGVRLYCDGDCLLDFETGLILSEAGGEYEWAGGGSYVLTGDLYTLPLGGGVLVATGTLLSGEWDSPVEGDILFVGSTAVSLTIEGTGFDVKNPDLVAFYGLGPDFVFANTNISSNITSFVPGDEGNFEAVIVEADLANFQSPARVPEPGTVILLGAGLGALGLYTRRRGSKS